MKSTLLFLLLSSCSHRIVRQGYDIQKSDYIDCNVEIVKYYQTNDSVTVLGEITIGESGFSVACSEEHAIEILKNEACAINAHLINITSEKRPDLWSSCYRCNAEFIKYNNADAIPNTNQEYHPTLVNERVTNDRNQNTAVLILSVIVGFTLGYMLFQ